MSMDPPNKVYPKSPTSVPGPFPGIIPDPSFNSINFEQLLQNRGIRFIHTRATPCPNLKSLDARGHNPNCPICAASGYLYYGEREIWGTFTNNALERLFEIQGHWEVGNAVITFPALYPDGSTPAEFSTFDKLLCPDFMVRLWELKPYEPTGTDMQQLRYSVQKVDFAASVINDVLKEYKQDIDFNVVDGKIKWISGRQPAFNPITGLGELVSFSYFSNPIFIVQHHMHELRVTQELKNGEKVATRFPQQVLVKREFLVFPNESLRGT